MRYGLLMNRVSKGVIAQQIAATCTALFQGKKDPISLCWKDYYNENDNNLICSNTNISDDQQNITCQDNTIRMSKRPPVTKNGDFYGKKSSYRKYTS